MRTRLICGAFVAMLSLAHATTLQQLTLDDMIKKSTAIVRGTVLINGGVLHGRYIYTHYTVRVVEQWKGAPATQMEFVVPGGSANGMRESIAGAPSLVSGQEYVLYLWTGRNGLTQVIGLSQGLFNSANGMVTRSPITDPVIGTNGGPVSDTGMQMTLSDMRNRVAAVLKARS